MSLTRAQLGTWDAVGSSNDERAYWLEHNLWKFSSRVHGSIHPGGGGAYPGFGTRFSESANIDRLTGMHNRQSFLEKLRSITSGNRREDKSSNTTIYLVHIAGLEDANKYEGVSSGDTILREISDRLKLSMREGDFIARVSGNEFGIITTNTQDVSEIRKIADKIREVIGTKSNNQSPISVSIGIGMSPRDSTDVDALMKSTTNALSIAKDSARISDKTQFSDTNLDKKNQEKNQLEKDLVHAIDNGELFVEYQPIVDETGKTISLEALIRWKHPQKGLISPIVFIPLAEEKGLIHRISYFVAQKVSEELRSQGTKTPAIAINISPIQLSSSGLIDMVNMLMATCNECGISTMRIELEITENSAMEDFENSKSTIEKLQGLGIRISLDDFGTGYSSLSRMRDIPFDKIKIDRSFISKLPSDKGSLAQCRFIIEMAHLQGLKVVAEGIETEEQFELLKSIGCDYFQGYLFSKPITSDKIGATIKKIQERAIFSSTISWKRFLKLILKRRRR